MSLAEIAAVVDGEVVGDPETTVSGPAVVDSRLAAPGGLFVAVVGERVDGHAYADQAAAAGAVAVLSSRPTSTPGVVVADPVAALGRLAHHVLDRLPEVRVVALTGSQGKTSTKDLLAHVLRTVLPDPGQTVATFGSFNNELGLPLTVLRADRETRVLVLEMGARHVGDLRASCAVAAPRVSLVLNVGKAHLGEFGSREAIAQAKGEIVDALDEHGTAVLNADDPRVLAMASRCRGSVLTFGTAEDADVGLREVRVDPLDRAAFELEHGGRSTSVTLGLVGEHHAMNAAAAAAAALAVGEGFDLDAVGAALASARRDSPGRMDVRERADGVSVVDDAYNANPDSMRAALKSLAAMGRGRDGARTIAVLGEMRELGASAHEEHDALGRLAVRLDIHQLLVVGQAAKSIHLGACLEGSWAGESVFVPDVETARDWLEAHLGPGDVVLFKASNAVRLSDLAAAVLAGPREAVAVTAARDDDPDGGRDR